jgi:hypothetical protein
MSLKNPVTPPGIDPGTVRLVAQSLNHYATPGPQTPLTQRGHIIFIFSKYFKNKSKTKRWLRYVERMVRRELRTNVLIRN